MILDINGRKKSKITNQERLKGVSDMLPTLSDDEVELLEAVLSEIESGDTDLLDLIDGSRYKYKPVPIDEFLLDDYYMGISTKTLYPKLREDLGILFGDDKYTEVVLTGSIGYGKTMMGSLIVCRMLYEMSCLIDAHSSFGLSPGSEIVFALLSKNLYLARTILKTAVEDKLKLSPYFNEHFRMKQGRDITTFPGNIMMSIGSYQSERVIGANVFGAVLDEANFAQSRGEVIRKSGKKTLANYDYAEKIYTSLVRRIKSRFQKVGQDLPGMVVLLSSATTIGSFMERRIEEAKESPTIFVRDYATWDVKEESYFGGEKFKILVGGSSLRSRILKDGEEVSEAYMRSEGAKIIEVPMDYLLDFQRDLEGCLVGDTRISLLDGREVPISELVGVEEFWVYSFDSDGKLKPGRGHSARLTGKGVKIVKVLMDNGKSVKCTSNHRFMLRSGKYKEAKDLVGGDSLMPLYRKFDKNGYFLFKSNVNGGWYSVHGMIAREYYLGGGLRPSGKVVHHIDHNKMNCNPGNLRIVDKDWHCEYHSNPEFLKLGIHSPEAKAKSTEKRRENWEREVLEPWQEEHVRRSAEQFRVYNRSEHHREVAAKTGRIYGFGNKNPTDKQKKAHEDNAEFIREYAIKNNVINNPARQPGAAEKISKAAKKRLEDPEYLYQAKQRLLFGSHVRWHVNRGIVSKNCYFCQNKNHKVVSVCECGTDDVYDITVDEYSNFSLTSGVVVHNSLRDVAGIATHAISKFVHRIEAVDDCVDKDAKHPFTVQEWVTGEVGEFIWDWLAEKKERRLSGAEMEDYWVPFRNPKATRFAHIDTSLSGDSTGICVGHIDRMVEVVRRNQNLEEFNDIAPYFVIDFMMRINPPSGDQIYLPDVRRLLYELIAHGFKIRGFSVDGFQSAECIQQMRKKGVTSKVFSVDTNIWAYEGLKSAVYESRIEYYEYEPFMTEFKGLEYDPLTGRVDHARSASKDVSDAVAGVVAGLTKLSAVERIPPEMTMRDGAEEDDSEDMSWVTGNKLRLRDEKKSTGSSRKFIPIQFG